MTPELARVGAVANGVLVLNLLERDPGESLAAALVGRGLASGPHVVEGAALDEHLVQKLQEARLLRVRAGYVVVVHVEHAEELHARLAE
eukprot:3544412-Pyramimonas_sp.AAC.1